MNRSNWQRFASVNVFGVGMLNIMMQEALDLIDLRIRKKIKTSVYFVNADCLNKVFVDTDYCHILHGNEVNFADGSGIALAGKILRTPIKDNVNGTDMLPRLCDMAVKNGYSLYFLGAAPGVAEAMKDNLIARFPQLQVCGTRDGFFDHAKSAPEVIKEINNSKADILLVAFGAPLQEKFIFKHFDQIDAYIQMGVGGLFDFYSGRIPRAPLWLRKIGMEWTFRLAQEPKRMWRRYILGNPIFVFRVVKWILRGKPAVC